MNKFKVTPFLNEKENKDSSIFPIPLRALILGKSGSGKTTLLWNIITKYWIKFDYLYIFTKSVDQPIYKNIQDVFSGVDIEIFVYERYEDLITVDDCKSNSLVVFDDCILEQQTIIRDYFVRSRPKNISCIYLSQSYSMVDMKVIRNNLNFLIVFNQSMYYLKKIWEEFICSNMTLKEFHDLCQLCWKTQHSFLSINVQNCIFYNKFERLR